MRSRVLAAMVFLTSIVAVAHDSGSKKSGEYLIKNKMRIYSYGGGPVLGSIEVPAGFTLRYVSTRFKDFRKGIMFYEASIREFPEVVATLKSGQIKRVVGVIPVWGGVRESDKEFIKNKNTLVDWARSVGVGNRKKSIKDGEFEYEGGGAYFDLRKNTDTPKNHIEQFAKHINIKTKVCSAGFIYTERDPKTGHAIDPKDWKFEHIGDEIARSFLCEKD